MFSRKSSSKTNKERIALLWELRGCKATLNTESVGNLITCFHVEPTLEDEIVKSQLEDSVLRKLAEKVKCERRSDYAFRSDGTLLKDKRLCVSNNKALKESILEKTHSSAYIMHPGSTRMFRTLRAYYWWSSMRRKIVKFVAKYLICQQVKQ